MTDPTVVDVKVPEVQTQGNPVGRVPLRALAGWMNDDEGVRTLLGGLPAPTDDLTAIQQTLVDLRAAVRTRPKVDPEDPVVSGDRPALDEVAARPGVQASFVETPWRVEWVDLTKLLSIQKIIKTEGLEPRVMSAATDTSALVELCLPNEQDPLPQPVFWGPDARGITTSSPNPNLRIAGPGQIHPIVVGTPAGVPARKLMAVMFLIDPGMSYLQVAHYNGRYFLRDGYHRAAGLLRAGITVAPAILVEAPSYEFVIASVPGLFGYEVAFSDQPPLLTDFWDDAVAADAFQPTIRKVVRIQADEFVVQG